LYPAGREKNYHELPLDISSKPTKAPDRILKWQLTSSTNYLKLQTKPAGARAQRLQQQQQQQQQLPNSSRFCGVWGDPDVHDLTPMRTRHRERQGHKDYETNYATQDASQMMKTSHLTAKTIEKEKSTQVSSSTFPVILVYMLSTSVTVDSKCVVAS